MEEALRASGLALVMDESQYCWPQYVRPRGTPSRMMWVKTMFDAGTPFALMGFKFSEWRRLYAEKTNWGDEQFERRLNRTVTLPAAHSESDLFKIARAILPDGDKASHTQLAAIARLNPKKDASAMVEAIATARDFCEQEGRDEITFDVLERAIRTNHPEMIPAEPASTGLDDSDASPRRTRRNPPRVATGTRSISPLCTASASTVQAPCRRPEFGQPDCESDTFAGTV